MSSNCIVTVVRDYAMYDKCVGKNPNLADMRLIVYDNNLENLTITQRYNSFIDSITPNDDFWVVFCHEDWRADEPLNPILSALDPKYIYGPVGIFLQHRFAHDYVIPVGRIDMYDKNGENYMRIAPKMKTGRVDTLDCQCVIVHTSLLREYNLRFDENLQFDMYVEDFCASAHECYDISTRVCAIKCTHFSYGFLSERFFNSLRYVQNKYSVSRKAYATTVGNRNTFGTRKLRVIHHARLPHTAALLNGIFFKKNR